MCFAAFEPDLEAFQAFLGRTCCRIGALRIGAPESQVLDLQTRLAGHMKVAPRLEIESKSRAASRFGAQNPLEVVTFISSKHVGNPGRIEYLVPVGLFLKAKRNHWKSCFNKPLNHLKIDEHPLDLP